MATILIKNGRIVDGSGSKAFDGSLLINGDRIELVLRKGEALPQADTSIDAAGWVVAPGFIDMHSHADWVLPVKRQPELLKCFLEQGITTVIGGNCGFSPAPIVPEKNPI
jgi:N-acyl-D-amino-acid deacylase